MYPFKVCNSVGFVYSELCNHHHNHFQNILSLLEELALLSYYCPSPEFPRLPSPRQPLIYFLFLRIGLFFHFIKQKQCGVSGDENFHLE